MIISRNVDLSVGSVLGLSAYVSGSLFGNHPRHLDRVASSSRLVGAGIGVACGIVNGALTTIGRVPSLVVTLATLYIIRGIDTCVVGGGEVVASSLPNPFLNIPQATIAVSPYLAIVVVAVVARRRLLPALVPLGPRALRDRVESGRRAARRHPGRARVFTAFVISGALAGIAGVLWAAQYGTIDSTAGTGYELHGDRRGRGRRRGDLRRQRQRRRRGARRAAPEHDQLRRSTSRDLGVLGRRRSRAAADPRRSRSTEHHAAADRGATTEVRVGA